KKKKKKKKKKKYTYTYTHILYVDVQDMYWCYDQIHTYMVSVTCDMMSPEILEWKKSEGMDRYKQYIANVKILQSQILSSKGTTQVWVQLSDPGMDVINAGPSLFPQWWNETWRGHIDHRFITFNAVPRLQSGIVFPNITIPVCSTLLVNSDRQVFRHDPPPSPHTKHFVHSLQESQREMLGLDLVKRKFHLAACVIIRVIDDTSSIALQVQQWIEYHRMQGFEHFYIYDHDTTCNNEEFNLYDVLAPYVLKGIVTHIKFAVRSTIRMHPNARLFYQHAQINSCLARFRYESDFIADFDIDEWMLPNYDVNFSDYLIRQMIYRLDYNYKENDNIPNEV
ncbi:glycosyl transferase, family 2, partial [Reticulomyxa filosa]